MTSQISGSSSWPSSLADKMYRIYAHFLATEDHFFALQRVEIYRDPNIFALFREDPFKLLSLALQRAKINILSILFHGVGLAQRCEIYNGYRRQREERANS